MGGLADLPDKDWGKGETSVIKPVLLARGTLESIDISKTKLMCEEVLGFECAMLAADRMIMRHRSDAPGSVYWVLEVRQVSTVQTPQHLTNHWGIWIKGRDAVDRACELLQQNMTRYGLLRVQPPRPTHEGARDYSFYFEDESHVWWEIGEHPNEDAFMDLFGHGDWDSQGEVSA